MGVEAKLVIWLLRALYKSGGADLHACKADYAYLTLGEEP